MELKNLNVSFFLLVLTATSIITFFIFKPFFIALILAAILAIFFQKMYAFILSKTKNKKVFSSLLTSLAVFLIIVIPVVVASIFVGKEIISAYHSISVSDDFYQRKVEPIIGGIKTSPLYDALNLKQFVNREAFSQYSKQLGQLAFTFVQNAYSGVSHMFFMLFVMFFALYYFFIDGKEIVKKFMYISPIKDLHESLLVEKFVSMSRATIKGTFVVCIVQGLLGGMVFYIVGIQSAVIWGVVMMLFSLIPMLGSAIVWFPMGIILLMAGNVWQGVLVLIVGFSLISTIDNILKPKLVGKDTQMHPLLVLLATLGGLALFGPAGVIVGPIVVALFVSLWEIYGIEFEKQLKKYNNK
ncbi:MAG TPA: AI-2E family transporter [Candidatus Moranbacteria bacterium]|nr:AI-2E family transporter [Candidatus Moranbacteria bacterium]